MLNYKNKHLTEVVCSFSFFQEESKWDTGFFGQYFDKIKSLGFDEREDRKGIQIQFSGNLQELLNPVKPLLQEVETQMLYRGNKRTNAIILGNKSISFHKVVEYNNWDDFKKNLIVPAFDEYKNLGLSSKVQTCQFTYLNKFEFNADENLADFFTLIPPSLSNHGEERGTSIDTKYQTQNNIIIVIRLFANPIINGKRTINLECGATAILSDINHTKDYLTIAEDVHAPIRDFFEKIITQKLRDRL